MGYCPFVSTYVSVLKQWDGSNFTTEDKLIPLECVKSVCQCWDGDDCGLKASNLKSYMQQKDTTDTQKAEEEKAAEEAAAKEEENKIPDIPYYVPLVNEFMGNEDRDGDGKLYGKDFKITDDEDKPIALKGLEEHPDWVEPQETINWLDYIAALKAMQAKAKEDAEKDEEDDTPTDDTPVDNGPKYKSIILSNGGGMSWYGRYDGFNSIRFLLSNVELFEKPDYTGPNLLKDFGTGNISVSYENGPGGHFKEHAVDGKDDTYWDSMVDSGGVAWISFNFGDSPKSVRSMRLKSLTPSNMSFRGVCLPQRLAVAYTTEFGQQSSIANLSTEDTTDTQSFSW